MSVKGVCYFDKDQLMSRVQYNKPSQVSFTVEIPEDKPVEMQPVEMQPVEMQPVVMQPVEMQPVVMQPVVMQSIPDEIQPVEMQPAVMQSIPDEMQPVVMQSIPDEIQPVPTTTMSKKEAEFKQGLSTLISNIKNPVMNVKDIKKEVDIKENFANETSSSTIKSVCGMDLLSVILIIAIIALVVILIMESTKEKKSSRQTTIVPYSPDPFSVRQA